jgi:hypothetical protein
MSNTKHELPTYSDGHPLDEIHYREYKILLKAARFNRPEGFKDYWHEVKHIGKKLGVDVYTNDTGYDRLVREVLFYDTPNFDLYNNAFIVRKRTFYKDGWPELDHQLTVKFRHVDIHMAAAADIHPRLEGETKIKFKEELLPLKDQLGGVRSLYSHNCDLVSPNIVLDQGLADIAKVFPAMQRIDVHPETKINLVNNMAVEEVQVDIGHFDFGHGYEAKATIAIWRNRSNEQSLVGEFAFQAKFKREDEVHHKAKALSETFYKAVQTEAPDWVELGTTKTALVYKLGGKPINHHE